MAARILPFRSLVPAVKATAFAPTSGALYDCGQRGAPKVVAMSKLARSRPSYDTRVRRESSFTAVDCELRDGYIEVGLRGISLRRMADVYAVILRGAWAATLSGVRALLRPAASSEV